MTWVDHESWWSQIPPPWDLLGLPDPLRYAPRPMWFSLIQIEDMICLGLMDRAAGGFLPPTPTIYTGDLFETQPPVEQRWIGNMN